MKLRWREVDGDTLELEDSKTGPETGAAEPRGARRFRAATKVGKPLGISLAGESGAGALRSQPVEEGCGSWPVSRMCAFTTSGTLGQYFSLSHYYHCIYFPSVSYRNHIVTGLDLYRDATRRVTRRHLP